MKLNFKNITFFAGASILMMSCSRNPDSPGYEYMPDMYRSQAVEAYVDYGLVKDVEHADLKESMSARKPAMGTIPFNADPEMAAVMMPYSLTNTDAGYNEAKENAIPMKYVSSEDAAKANAEEGKVLFGYFCSHCHGKTGKGDGAVVTYGEFNAPLPYDGGYKDRSLGQIFHVITYGKGAMGPHGSQLNKDERWKVALYVRTLQHGDLKFDEIASGATGPKTAGFFNIVNFGSAMINVNYELAGISFSGSTTDNLSLTNESKSLLDQIAIMFTEDSSLQIEINALCNCDIISNEERMVLTTQKATLISEHLISKGAAVNQVFAYGQGSSNINTTAIDFGEKILIKKVQSNASSALDHIEGH